MRVLLLLNFSIISISVASQPSSADGDVLSIDRITTAVLESISGEKGEQRDWTRFRKLFLPSAQLNAIFHRGDSTWIKKNTVDEFISQAGTWYEDNGFKEFKVDSKVVEFGNIAHVFQSYRAVWSEDKEQETGMNSFQLAYLNNRWWIVNLIWDVTESITTKSGHPKAA